MNGMRVFLKLSFCVLVILSANASLARGDQEKKSIAAIFEETLAEQGLEAAKAKFHEMMADTSGMYILDPFELVVGLPNRLSMQGKRDKAIELLKLLEPTYGDIPHYWLSIGNAYLFSGERENTERALKKVLEMAPERTDIAWELDNIDELMRIARIQVENEGKYQPGQSTGIQGPYLGQDPPGRKPEVFAPGILCSPGHEYSISFSPDGREIYFSRGGVGIMVCRWEKEGWTAPQIVTFIGGGAYSDEAHIAPDGKRIFFCSRPSIRQPREIYVAGREGGGWSEPRHLFPGMYATSTLDGTLYYTTDIPGQRGNSDIVKRRRTGDGFSELETPSGGVNSETQDAHPFIAPDESYILFDSIREGLVGLCLCYRQDDGSWSDAIYLRDILGIPPAGQAAVSPDGKYVFFCLAGDMYWASADFIDDLRPE